MYFKLDFLFNFLYFYYIKKIKPLSYWATQWLKGAIARELGGLSRTVGPMLGPMVVYHIFNSTRLGFLPSTKKISPGRRRCIMNWAR